MDLDLDVGKDRVELVRDPTAATVWTVLAGFLLGIVGWLVVDSRGHAVAWVLLALAVVVSAYFVVQLAIPRAVRLTFGPDGMDASTFGRRVTIGWDEVIVARVREVAGERMLVVDTRRPGASTPAIPHRIVGILLPIGVDLELLHAVLERRLGRGDGRRSPTPAPGT